MAVAPESHPSLPAEPQEHPAPQLSENEAAKARFLQHFKENPELDAGRPESAKPPEAAEPQRPEPEPPPQELEAQEPDGEEPPRQEAETESDDSTTDAEADADAVELDAEQLTEFLGVPVQVTEEGDLRVTTKVDGKTGDATLNDLVKSYQTDAHLTNRGKALSEREKAVADRAESIEQQATAAENFMATLYQAIESLNPYLNYQSDDQTEMLIAQNNARDYREKVEGIFRQAEFQRRQMADQATAVRDQHQHTSRTEQAELLSSKVPGWGAEMRSKIESYARDTYGATDAQMAEAATAWWMVDALRKAQLYDSGQKTVKSKKLKKLPKPMKPGSRKSAAAIQQDAAVQARQRLAKSGKGEDFIAFLKATTPSQ